MQNTEFHDSCFFARFPAPTDCMRSFLVLDLAAAGATAEAVTIAARPLIAVRLANERRAAGRIPSRRATRLASRGRRRRRDVHTAAVSGRSIETAFLKTPRSRASQARVRARGDARERTRDVEDCYRRAWHRYRAHAAQSTTRAPPSVSPPPSPARVRAPARNRSHDARRRRRNRRVACARDARRHAGHRACCWDVCAPLLDMVSALLS